MYEKLKNGKVVFFESKSKDLCKIELLDPKDPFNDFFSIQIIEDFYVQV